MSFQLVATACRLVQRRRKQLSAAAYPGPVKPHPTFATLPADCRIRPRRESLKLSRLLASPAPLRRTCGEMMKYIKVETKRARPVFLHVLLRNKEDVLP